MHGLIKAWNYVKDLMRKQQISVTIAAFLRWSASQNLFFIYQCPISFSPESLRDVLWRCWQVCDSHLWGTNIWVFLVACQQELQPSQYNFSVHKHNRYRWQKRVLQVSKKESNNNSPLTRKTRTITFTSSMNKVVAGSPCWWFFGVGICHKLDLGWPVLLVLMQQQIANDDDATS